MMVSLLRTSASPEAPPLLYPSAFSRPRLLSSQDHSPSLSVQLTVAAVRCHPEHGAGAAPPVGVVCGRGHQPREAVQREWCPSASEPLQLPLPSLISSLVLTSKELACCSVAQSCPNLQHHGLQHARPPCPSPIPGACSNSCSLSQ